MTLMRGPEGKELLGRSRCRSVDDTKTDLREIGWSGMGLIVLAQDGASKALFCEDGNETLGFKKCWEVLEWLQKWRSLHTVSLIISKVHISRLSKISAINISR